MGQQGKREKIYSNHSEDRCCLGEQFDGIKWKVDTTSTQKPGWYLADTVAGAWGGVYRYSCSEIVFICKDFIYLGCLHGLVSYASGLRSGHDPRVLGRSPASGSPSPSPHPWINKILTQKTHLYGKPTPNNLLIQCNPYKNPEDLFFFF